MRPAAEQKAHSGECAPSAHLRPPATSSRTLEEAGAGQRLAFWRPTLQRVVAEGLRPVGHVEVDEIVLPSCRDPGSDTLGQVAIRIDECQALAGNDIGENEPLEQRRLPVPVFPMTYMRESRSACSMPKTRLSLRAFVRAKYVMRPGLRSMSPILGVMGSEIDAATCQTGCRKTSLIHPREGNLSLEEPVHGND